MISRVRLISLFLTNFPSQITQTRWIGIVLVGNFILPFWWLSFLENRGFILDDTLANHKLHRQRLMALWPIAVIIGVEVIFMFFRQMHEPLFAVLLSSFAIAIIGGFISYYWKISAHTIGFSSTITLLTLLLGLWVLWTIAIFPLLAWARLKLHRHTPLQLLIGTILPPLLILLIFNYFNLI